MMPWLLFSACICAVIPALLFCVNLIRYRTPPYPAKPADVPAVSVLIPARNEAGGIEDAVCSVLSTTGCDFEVIVMDDGSTDETAALVTHLAAEDPRVRLELAPGLPAGWNGKQHACWALANSARHPVLCFMDADVRLEPECVARMAGLLVRGANGQPNALVSGFPRQVTATSLEWLLLPLIHFVLLGFLPLGKMRKGTDPSFSAGCGQFMMVRREAYFTSGGHSGIKRTMHDGLRLPRLLREHGFHTDLGDLTSLASCRMYSSAAQVWSGLAKNATEGLGDPRRIGPVSLALLLGQVLPFLMLGLVLFVLIVSRLFGTSVTSTDPRTSWMLSSMLFLSLLAAWLPRWLAVWRFRQDWRSALLHPLGILLLLCVQWFALIRKVRGGTVSWRDRAYAGGA